MAMEEVGHEKKTGFKVVLTANRPEVGVLGVVGGMIVEKMAPALEGQQFANIPIGPHGIGEGGDARERRPRIFRPLENLHRGHARLQVVDGR